MGIFDIFSSSPGTAAANQAYRAQTQGLKSGQQQATQALQQGTAQGVQALQQGQQGALGSLGQAAGYINQGLPTWQNLENMGQQGLIGYGELLSNPSSVFTSPLYQAREQAGIDAINRGANARGMLSSGNNTQDILDYMKQGGLDYFNTLAGAYQPYFGLAENAAAGQGGMYRDLASLGQNAAGIQTGTAGEIAGLQSGLGSNLANINWQAGLGRGQAGANLAQNKYAAQQGASGNIWNAILGLGGLASQTAGMFA